MYKFKKGDRVTRRQDVYNDSSSIMHGTIVLRYSKPQEVYSGGDLVLGPYQELYKVRWDNGKVDGGYLPHGLDKE